MKEYFENPWRYMKKYFMINLILTEEELKQDVIFFYLKL